MRSSFIKFSVCILFISILLVSLFSSAYADAELPSKQKVKNKSLINVIKKTDYASWEIYGPADSEIVGKNIYSTAFFKNATTFPLVAVKGDQTVLLIMQRSGSSWILLSANENALERDDFILCGFTIGTSSYDDENPSVLVSFDFSSKSHPNDRNYRYSLGMWINGKDEFINLLVMEKEHELEQCSDYYSVIINDKVLIYRCHKPNSFERIDYCFTHNPVDNSLSSFSLSALPIIPSDMMIKTQIHSIDNRPINLYLQPDAQSDTVLTIPDHSAVLIMNESIIYNDMQWYLVRYENSLGYVLCSHIECK